MEPLHKFSILYSVWIKSKLDGEAATFRQQRHGPVDGFLWRWFAALCPPSSQEVRQRDIGLG